MNVRKIIIVSLTLLALANVGHAEIGLEPMPPTMVAEDFKLPDINGEPHTLSSHLGHFVLVNFWTADCMPCQVELGTFQDMLAELKDYDIDVLAVYAGDNVEGVKKILETTPLTYPIVFDSKLTLGHWGVPILPTTFIINPEGKFVFRAIGTQVWNAPYMVDFLKNLMDNKESYGQPLLPST